ncbi:hypothetical protein DFH08DRAFT_711902, partial [Mycena albidolilacea]
VWTLYLPDLKVLSDATTDILLAGVFITDVEQADDVILSSLAANGMQRKMNALRKWCSVNFMVINAIRSLLIICSSIPKLLPIFRFGAKAASTKYISDSIKRNIFKDHYDNQASKARAIANTLLGLESMVSVLRPWEACKVYVALVDPHLTQDREVGLDADLDLFKPLEDNVLTGVRNMMGVNKRSLVASLVTEAGLISLCFRGVILALSHLKYLLAVNDNRYVKVAACNSVLLLDSSKASGPCRHGSLLCD